MPTPLLQVIALIDGFNLYHAVSALGDSTLKWCDVSALVRQFLRDDERLAETRYYTANPVHFSDGVQGRHAAYVAAIQARGGGSLVVQRGHFKRKRPQILKCDRGGISVRIKTKFHEEKETDVRIAVDMMDLAQQSRCDALVLVSGDSDQLPAVERVLQRFPRIRRFIVLLPPGQKAEILRKLEKKWPNRVRVSQVKRGHIDKSRMPERFSDPAGKDHRAPKSYRDSAPSRFPSEIM